MSASKESLVDDYQHCFEYVPHRDEQEHIYLHNIILRGVTLAFMRINKHAHLSSAKLRRDTVPF